ncbi:MAG: amino acid adenylation domain-containing protein [Herbinix sp.]|nr:amino acid adenylation domain-containing protein [Herbinix sp.]
MNNNYDKNNFLADAQMTTEKAYWMNKLSGELTISYFPRDFFAPENSSKVMEEEEFCIQQDLCKKLLLLSKSSDVKLHMIFSAALMILVNKYTGKEDIILGTPIYKQKEQGVFINTVLALRGQLDESMSYKELLIQVRKIMMEAVENQNYTIQNLFYDLSIADNKTSLFDIAILVDGIQDKSYFQETKPNIIFSFGKDGESIFGKLEYNAALYKESTIRGIMHHYLKTLSEVMSNVDTPIKNLDILLENEKRCLLDVFNRSSCWYENDKTAIQLFEEQVEQNPDKQAVYFNDEHLTYRQLNERANYIAQILRDKGVKPDSIVVLMLEKSLNYTIAIIGILKAGGAFLSIDIDYPMERVKYILNDSGAVMVLTDSDVANKFPFDFLQKVEVERMPLYYVQKREPIINFDSIPIPDRTLIDYDKYSDYIGQAMVKNSIAIQATRGCPFECAYCCRIWSKTHVTRSADHIFNEIQIYYNIGVRRFVFIDDVFNLNIENGIKLFHKIIDSDMKIQIFFPNGVRGDVLTKEYIDLMIKAGTVSLALSLETASPRLQKYLKKNLDLQKFKENAEYIASTYPNVILNIFTMHGFPTETEEEAMMTLDFIKSIRWFHFPTTEVLKIYPGTEIEKIALENGVTKENIEASLRLPDRALPYTLPFARDFTIKYQTLFLNEYFLNKERLLHVLPIQKKILTEDELVKKYQSYLPIKVDNFDQLLQFFGIGRKELGDASFIQENYGKVERFREKLSVVFPKHEAKADALRILFLDLSSEFNNETDKVCVMKEPPLGQMYLLTYLNDKFKDHITGRIAKAGIDFNNYKELKSIMKEFNPNMIGVRSLSLYRDFFHRTIAFIKQWNINVPIIAGGPYATSEYEEVIKDKNVNIAILGEGEETFYELVKKTLDNHNHIPNKEALQKIKGIAFMYDKDMIREKPDKREILLLDCLLDDNECTKQENLEHINRPDDLAYVIYTSGTTGKPKGVMAENRGLANLQAFFRQQLGVTNQDRILQFANVSFDASVWESFMAMLTGATLYIVDRDTILNNQRFEEYMNENDITIATLPPTYMQNLIPDHIKSLRKLITAGSASNFEIVNEWSSKVEYYNAYGPTETTVCATIWKSEADLKKYNSVPIGKPISNMKCYIVDKNNRLQLLGVVGELCVSGEGLTRGYLNRPDITLEKFVDNPFEEHTKMYRTGDLARWLPDGNIEFLGRTDFQVKIRGHRIEIGEIESTILSHANVNKVVVMAREDNNKEQVLCAYVVHDEALSFNELRDYLTKSLPYYMIPSYFISIDDVPLTPNGKVDTKALLKISSDMNNDMGYQEPRNDAEKRMALIWKEILGVDKIGVDDNFFLKGGDSIKAIQICTRLREACYILEVKDLFQYPTISELCTHITIAKEESALDEDIEEEDDFGGLSAVALEDLMKTLTDKINHK